MGGLYYFSQPIPKEDNFEKVLKNNNSTQQENSLNLVEGRVPKILW